MPINSIKTSVSRVDKSLPLPQYETRGSLGFDFLCREDVLIKTQEIALVPANLIVKVPDGFVLMVTLRSSTPRKKGLIMPHGVGIIDSDYCGPEDEIKIQVQNISPSEVQIKRGERIAQGLFLFCRQAQFQEIENLSGQSRGGFGSTG